MPLVVIEHSGARYLVSYRGESDWARNLRAATTARLHVNGQIEEISVEEVPLDNRAALLATYHARYARMPTVGRVLRDVPDPRDHPIFRIISSRT